MVLSYKDFYTYQLRELNILIRVIIPSILYNKEVINHIKVYIIIIIITIKMNYLILVKDR